MLEEVSYHLPYGCLVCECCIYSCVKMLGQKFYSHFDTKHAREDDAVDVVVFFCCFAVEVRCSLFVPLCSYRKSLAIESGVEG